MSRSDANWCAKFHRLFACHVSNVSENANSKIEFTEASEFGLSVHPLTESPSKAWRKCKKKQKSVKLENFTPGGPVEDDKVRVVCMSDTHCKTSIMPFDVPSGDIFIHAGDFTNSGSLDEVVEFNEWLGTLPHKHKIVIAGNHELSFDPTFTRRLESYDFAALRFDRDQIEKVNNLKNIKQFLTNCDYLEDSMVERFGLKIYGTPWQPEYGGGAFNLPRGRPCLDKWNLIPEGVDILVTHSPPLGHGDHCWPGVRAGCVDLLVTVQERVKPKYHVFGHVHEGYGVTTDGNIIYMNASSCNLRYLPVNRPIVFDIALPNCIAKTLFSK
ncbi:metallophosphoesterase MPPED2-like [Adelges cooleyi]|uniref:metallophosphoesterase MPPED2-like n=1 Tax=Adelges cooleyi TaxID=133065 RepID=UPI00217F68A7|nr:metallophosphoesterase MPPED2-like [Adelges cooleyi]